MRRAISICRRRETGDSSRRLQTIAQPLRRDSFSSVSDSYSDSQGVFCENGERFSIARFITGLSGNSIGLHRLAVCPFAFGRRFVGELV
jgi:hypothetical protein